MAAQVTICELTRDSCSLEASGVKDLAHIRRLLVQSLVAVSAPADQSFSPTPASLCLLRSFLYSMHCKDRNEMRVLILACLLQMEDEDDDLAFVASKKILPPAALLR